eukprot:CAMPEP_0172471606 /NCGR_PEP_ID=MMETSP1065-20121228/67901_1 /TAXON_ID=265537 /ORGANISM="Amphiprora paludosa, Strain CCMP125" /LENGTH=454 /DNA_ID=CAMNT_0013229709 /DNA_START=165 /DNA_END=1529 /DNA_ORIENTATION=+
MIAAAEGEAILQEAPYGSSSPTTPPLSSGAQEEENVGIPSQHASEHDLTSLAAAAAAANAMEFGANEAQDLIHASTKESTAPRVSRSSSTSSPPPPVPATPVGSTTSSGAPVVVGKSKARPRSSSTTSASGAQATSSTSNSKSLRRGKWTVEEETYVARVIQDFNLGYLKAPAGTTLRTYLSEKLQCDPMRITKKFTGDACIGKRVFHPAVPTSASTLAAMEQAQAELEDLERQWRRRMELQQSESAKKAAASAAAVAAGCCLAKTCPAGSCTCGSTLVRAASWLERAKETLSATNNNKTTSSNATGSKNKTLTREEIMQQMSEVQRLLAEGPTPSSVVKSVNRGIALIPDSSSNAVSPARHASGTSVGATTSTQSTAAHSVPSAATASSLVVSDEVLTVPPTASEATEGVAHGTKRLRSDEQEETGAEADAKALVDFLQTVQQAAAAASQETN